MPSTVRLRWPSFFGCACFAAALALRGAPQDEQQWRDSKGVNKSNRYEGLAPELNSLRKYEIRGVFGGEDLASADSSGQLSISFYLPVGDNVSAFQVRELQPLTHYRMEPKIADVWPRAGLWNTFTHWPMADVLTPNAIRPADLGIVVLLRDPRVPELFAPAYFYSTGAKHLKLEAYSIFVISSTQVQKLRCTVRDQAGKKQSAEGKSYSCTLPNTHRSLEESQPARFQVNAANLPRGLVTVNITGDYPGDESGARLNAEIHFFHEPTVEVP